MKYFLAIDINTEKLKVIVFKTKGEKIIILGVSSQVFEKFSLFDSISFSKDIFKNAVSKALKEACQKIDEKIPRLNNIPFLVGLPANIFKIRIFSQEFKRLNSKIEINQKEEKDIYQKVLNESQREISKTFTHSYGILSKDLEFINLEILGNKIDGYEVPYLCGFKGQNLNFRIMAMFLPKYYLEEFKKIFKEMGLNISKIIQPAKNLKLAFGKDFSNGIFLNIESDLTQIFFMEEEKIFYISEFGTGERNFIQALSRTFGLTERTSQALKEKYLRKSLSEGVRKRIKETIRVVLRDWFSALKSKLNEAEKLPSFPNFCLFGEGSQLPEIQEILEEEENWKDVAFVGKPIVKLIYPKDLKNIEDKTLTLNDPRWISPILICYSSY